MQVHRGDIVIVELNPTKGSEQQGANRPCLVIQNDIGNQYSPTTIVAPFTTKYDPDDIYPFEVEVKASDSALNQDSVVTLSQIRTIDVEERVQRVVGSLSATKMANVDRAIEESLGL